MIHYNIWFNLKDEADDERALIVVQGFLCELYAEGSIAGFQILRNSGDPAKTKMLRYQALIEFSDDEQFAAAFSAQARRGIHTGFHGCVMALVNEFRIEVFKEIVSSRALPAREASALHSCEI